MGLNLFLMEAHNQIREVAKGLRWGTTTGERNSKNIRWALNCCTRALYQVHSHSVLAVAPWDSYCYPHFMRQEIILKRLSDLPKVRFLNQGYRLFLTLEPASQFLCSTVTQGRGSLANISRHIVSEMRARCGLEARRMWWHPRARLWYFCRRTTQLLQWSQEGARLWNRPGCRNPWWELFRCQLSQGRNRGQEGA